MNLRCEWSRRRLVPYVEGGLRPGGEARLNSHLARCPACREHLARVRAGHEAGRELGLAGPEAYSRPPDYEELRARAGGLRALRTDGWRRWPALIAASPSARVLGVFLLALVLLVVASGRRLGRDGDAGAAFLANARLARSFTPLTIAGFEPDTKSPVVTEGLVKGVYFDEKEKTLHIKIVEPGESAEPFVICEVRSPGRMAIPREGNRVRVYGMARFDPQPGRGWNEVNPVTSIDILKH